MGKQRTMHYCLLFPFLSSVREATTEEKGKLIRPVAACDHKSVAKLVLSPTAADGVGALLRTSSIKIKLASNPSLNSEKVCSFQPPQKP